MLSRETVVPISLRVAIVVHVKYSEALSARKKQAPNRMEI
jgi:hypothetical protein